MRVVSGEVLFALDFSMDFCALYFTERLRGKPIARKRVLLAAILSAAGGVAVTALGCTGGWLMVWFLLTATAAYAIADGIGLREKRLYDLAVGVMLFFLLEMAAGGMMTVAFSYLNRLFLARGVTLRGTQTRHTAFWLSAGGLCLVFSLLSYVWRREKQRALCRSGGVLTVTCNENDICVPCLFDSGCLAREPISGLPVIVLPRGSCDALRISYDALEQGSIPRSRLIPTATISGEQTLYWGIRPDKVTVRIPENRKNAARSIDVYAIFSPHTNGTAIVPMGL